MELNKSIFWINEAESEIREIVFVAKLKVPPTLRQKTRKLGFFNEVKKEFSLTKDQNQIPDIQ